MSEKKPINYEKLGITIININSFKGTIPPYHDLIIFEKGDPESGLMLNSFAEVGLFDHEFKNPTYGLSYWGVDKK